MPLSPENLQNSALVYLHSIKIRTQIIYSSTLFVILLSIAALPLISTTTYLKSTGVFQTSSENIALYSPISGYVSNINLNDNQKTTKGMILLTLDSAITNKEEYSLEEKEKRLSSWMLDIKKLLQNWQNANLKSPLYQTRNLQFKLFLKSGQLAAAQAKRNFDRYTILLEKKVISSAEFEMYDTQYHLTISNLQSAIASYKSQLQMDAKSYLDELSNLKRLRYSIIAQRKNYQLKAIENGFIQNLIGIRIGSYVFANQKIGEIVPNGKLFAYCYVDSRDIGMIRIKQHVIFQIDALNYNQWGTAEGVVLDIDEDTTTINDVPFFKIKCLLKKPYLLLKNGMKGRLKSGMAFTARFQVADRTLWELLTDKIINWLKTD